MSFFGAATFGAGRVGPGFQFTANNSYLAAADGPQWTFGSNAFTIELWANFWTTNGSRALVAHDQGGGAQNKWIFWMDGGQLRFHINGTLGNVNIGSGAFTPFSNVWYHLAVTRDFSNYTFFVNGSAIATNVDSRAIPDASASLTIGQAEGNFYFHGLLDEIGIYNRALSAAEISSIYAAGTAGKCRTRTGVGLPYFTDFESGVGAGWSEARWETSQPAFFTRFSGRFDNVYQTLTLTNLTPGQSHTLLFDFYPIDSWDGNSGGDFFYVGADGVQLLRDTFANFNGNPPSSSQSFPRNPDEGRAHFGFEGSFVDAIYRGIRLAFVPSNDFAILAFAGQGLQPISDESWGIDNVRVQTTADAANTIVHSSTLPLENTTNIFALDGFVIAASRPLLASTANNAANYSLREAGGNGLLGDGDDIFVALTPSFTSGQSVTLAVNNAPLQPGRYRFATTAGLQDTNGNAVTVFTREFVIEHPVLGRIENTSNATIPTATPLPTTESPSGSGLFTAFAAGAFSAANDVDYWRFDAEAGDRLTVRLETEVAGVNPQIILQNASGGNLHTVNGSSTLAAFQNYTFGAPGTYYLRAMNTSARGRYFMRVDQARGTQTESEANDSAGTANLLTLSISPGLYQGKVIGALPSEDSAGDWFNLGTLNVGNPITAFLQFPTGAVLNAANTTLKVYLAGNDTALVTSSGANLNFTVTTNGVHYLRVESTNRLLRAHYVASVAISDGVPPSITGTTLPGEGASVAMLIDRFQLTFSEDLVPAAVSNAANYELRGAGADATFSTPDDTLYTFGTLGYSSGLVSDYAITDGPLQPGAYRFTARTNLIDRASNPMAAPFVRHFTVTNVPGFMVEARLNDAIAGAGTMSATPTTTPDGTFSAFSGFGIGDGPEGIVAADFDGDGDADLAITLYNADAVRVLRNEGGGVFTTVTNLTGFDGAVMLVTGQFNSDTNLDLVVANYQANTVTLFAGNGNAGFLAVSNYAGFNRPYALAAGDFNKDGRLDVAVPNYGANNITVLFGSASGAFTGRTNYTTGSGAYQVAVGDLNNDTHLDLAVANYSSHTVSILLGSASGAFTSLTNIPVANNPRPVAIGDVTGDGAPDVLFTSTSQNTLAVLANNGNATFQPVREYGSFTTDAYEITLDDLNADGRLDVVMPGYGNDVLAIALNDGSGGFTNVFTQALANGPICTAIADYNGDGIKDLAITRHHSDALTIYLGNSVNPLAESPSGSTLRSAFARGNLSSTADTDYFRFSGTAGDRAVVAIESVGRPVNSSLLVALQRFDGGNLTTFNSDNAGAGQSVPITLPYTGTYLVRVTYNNDYQGEYRLRISTVRPPANFETEANNTVAQANALSTTISNGHLIATMAAYLSGSDSADFYQLGQLAAGTMVTLRSAQPAASGFAPLLTIHNAAGAIVASGSAGATNLTYTVPAGQGGAYYARMMAGTGGYTAGSETALLFDGGDDSVDLGNWFNHQTFTISLWLRPGSSQNTWADIIDNNHTGSRSWVLQYANTGSRYHWGLTDGSGAAINIDLVPNEWQHLAMTRDAANVNRVYLNGTLIGTSSGTGEIVYDGTQFLRLGRWGSGGRHWNGTLDEVRIWNRALTQSEIAAGMGASLAGNEAGLVGYWRFNEGSGTTAADLSPSNRVATLVNGPAWTSLAPNTAGGPGLLAQYLLHTDVADAQGPQVVSVSLPAEGTSSGALWNEFTVTFDEEISATVNTANRIIHTFGGRYYMLTDTAGTWAEVQAQAAALGGHLVGINDAAENSFLASTFGSAGTLWIGLSDAASEGNFTWANGDPLTFTFWNGGEPNNVNNEDYGQILSNGRWNDASGAAVLRGIVEITTMTDTDGDGIVNALDAFPNDPLNGFELRWAGADAAFGTSDDSIYDLNTTGYTSGTNVSFFLVDGPLQPGAYRFTVSTSVRDRFGNALAAPYLRLFTITNLPGYVVENRSNDVAFAATSFSTNRLNLPDGSFRHTMTYGVGSDPYFVISSLFNADTNQDAIVANFTSDSLSFLYGQGDGTFTSATNLPVGDGPIALALGDFTGGTNTDVAVSLYYASRVAIVEGDGAGNWIVRTNYAVGTNPRVVVAGDFNGDGRVDVATANHSGNSVTVLLADTNRNLSGRVDYPLGGSSQGLALGDVNGDGRLDLVAGNHGLSTVHVLLGLGDGTFTNAHTLPMGANPRAISLAHLNGDLHLDLLAFTVGDDRLRIAFGAGDGTFGTNMPYATSASDVYHIPTGDLDLDGDLDVVLPGYGGNRLLTLLNNGDGTLGSVTTYNPGGNPISAAIADFNGDGRPDIASANYHGNNLHVFLANDTEPLVLGLAGSGVRSVLARGSLWNGTEYDNWSFSGVAGDRLSVAIEAPGGPAASGLLIYVDRPDGSFISFYSDYNGYGQTRATLPVSGTYTVRVQPNYNFTGEYRLRITLAAPPTQIEAENNNAIGSANALTYTITPGRQGATVLGYLNLADANGDYFQLGNQTEATTITLGLRAPSFSPIVPTLAIFRAGGVLVTNGAPGATNLVYTIPSGGDAAYYARVTSSVLGLHTEYLLDIDMADTQPPFISGTTLPLEGTNLVGIVDRFSLTFSEDMLASTVQAAASYELRGAGADSVFGTADDELYTVLNSPAYSIGLSASFLIPDGPLQPGAYRFMATTNLADRPGLRMTAPFVRNFTLGNLPDFVFESRDNNSSLRSTSLSFAITNRPDGSLTVLSNSPVQTNPYFGAAGHLNGDTNLDFVVANFSSGSLSVLVGNGTGGFTQLTNYPGNNGAIAPVLGFFNTDSNLDVAVLNYNAAQVRVYLGAGDGTFAVSSNYTVGSQPYNLAAGDLNGDGRPDLVVANRNSDSISVLLGAADGTFANAVNYPAGDGAMSVAIGDVNGDGFADVVTANSNSDNVSLFLGNGNGTFPAALSIAANTTPRSVVMGDFDKDGDLDLAVANGGDNTLAVMLGNGDGSFATRATYGSGANDSYGIATADFNGDGWLDLAMAGYGNSRVSVFLNRRNGTFEPAATYAAGSNPIGVNAADFNHDGRTDLALVNYSGHNVTLMVGNDTEPLQPDANDGSILIGRARGNLYNNADVDYFSFSAPAGARIAIGAAMVGAPVASGLRYTLYRADGGTLLNFYADYTGHADASAIAPVSGTYFLAVSENYNHQAEYRLRVSVLVNGPQGESEGNDSIGAANTLTLTASGGRQRATVFGFVAGNEGSAGDYYRLGNLTPGTVITLQLGQPLSSTLNGVLGIYNSAGTLVTNAPAGTTNLVFTVGTEEAYFARVTASAGAGIFATYLLHVDLLDTTGPSVTGVNLPTAGSTNAGILDRFTVTVNKDLDASFTALNGIRGYNGNAYFLTDSTMSWVAAQAFARSRGGDLVTINDPTENEWLLNNFSPTFWIGFTDEAQEGSFVWASGQPVTYTNWNSGEPNNSGNEDYASMVGGGRWNDAGVSTAYRGLVEVSGADSDGDGMPNLADPYPNDPLNLFDLRASGADGIFDTTDDQVYKLNIGAYTSGLNVNFTVVDGPLQPGQYRFRVTGSLRDRFGNAAGGNFDRFFTVESVPHFVLENRSNNSAASATPLPMVEDPLGLRSGGGRGKIADNSDIDFWSFSASGGDVFLLAMDVPGNPGASQLEFRLVHPNGSTLSTIYPSYFGNGQSAPIVLPTNGTYTIRVDRNYSYYGEYRLRAIVGAPPIQLEAEGNENIGTATPLALAVSGETRFANASGYINAGTDLDYFNLGTITNGSSIFLNVRLPGFSRLTPVVSIYNAANQYQVEAGNGRATDGVAEVRVTQTGTYYAVVRGTDSTAGMTEQYVLDVQVVPTGSVSFPNMQVVGIGLPTGGSIQSGQPITFIFTVENVGSLATPGANWIDRAVMSLNTTLGDSDDIPLGFIPHTGALAPGENYSVTNTVTLPDGIAGDYYIIVQTDAGNAVNEFLLEGDNITVSSATFPVTRAPYPDLVVEALSLSGPESNGVYTVNWTTANRGTAAAPGGFKERFFVRNLTSGAILVNSETTISNSLAVNGTLPQVRTFQTTNAGNYTIQITPDSQGQIYEFNVVSHASAEMNTASTNFSIVQFFNVSVTANPPGAAALLTGAGNYPVGTIVSVVTQPQTNSLPYQFVNWTEGGTFQSANTNYSFTLTRDRTLTANFTLPSYQVAASNSPSFAGTVSGQGTFFHGATNVLVANANPGYLFTNWTQNGVVVETSNRLTTVVTSNRFVVANYVEANTFHVVTTATSPTNVVTVAGAGTFGNGQTSTISAPLSVTNPPNLYTFREYRLNGAFAGTSASFVKTFSTLDPTNMTYVAVYDVASIRPVLVGASAVRTNTILGGFTTVTNPVPAMTNLQFTLQFDRTMNTAVTPAITLSNLSGGLAPTVPTGGVWFSTSATNDTYRTPFIALTNGTDGTNRVWVSGATDPSAITIELTNALTLVIDVTPPLHPAISLTASNNTSATFSWNGYSAPADLGGFRIYLSTNNFNSVTGLAQVTRVNAGTRSYTYHGLSLDRPYYAAAAAVDVAGNSSDDVTATAFILPSTIPPQVTIAVSATDVDSAYVSWSYNTANLLGFAGFHLYYEESNFTSVAGLAPKQSFGAGVRSAAVDGLDRTKTYYFAVVGYNGTNGFNPNVATRTWSDPYAGQISANLTIGGPNERVVDVLQPITVVSNATLTIQPGTTIRFAAGAGLTVQHGRLFANGTALDPIVFTALSGSWSGIVLQTNAGTSLLRHVFVEYGAGLTLDGCSPTVDAFTARFNQPGGLTLLNNATLTTTEALIANNGIGVQQSGPAQLNVRNSVIKNNSTNGVAAGSATLVATQNWWGTAASGDIDATLQGSVNRNNFLASEPLLTPAIGTSNNVTQIGTSNINLRLACRTAESMRLSEDSTFNAVFFAPFTNATRFLLSEGGGQKTIYAQFRSITGQTSAPVQITVNYITTGPTIAALSLAEGQLITRPINVTGSASAPLGMDVMEFYVNNVLQFSQGGGSLAFRFDVRSFSEGIHRVKLLARDTAGNFATLERNVTITPRPPAAPAITSPGSDLVISSNTINLAGTAEPLVDVRLQRGAAVVATTRASSNGVFSFSNVALDEGANTLVAEAFDLLGNASSPARNVVLDSGPPGAPVLDPLVYVPNDGVLVRWSLPQSGEAPTRFRVFWHTLPFNNTSEASGQSGLLTELRFTARGLTPGTYYIAAVGYDAAGNASALSGARSINYDPAAPSFTVSFDQSSPVGVGPLRVLLTASEPLSSTPGLTLRPQGSSPVALTISNTALNTYEGILNVTPSTPSGLMQLSVAAADLAGNSFNGAPTGPQLLIDVAPPSGRIVTAPVSPVQTTNNTDVTVNLVLSEAVKPDTTPQLSFNPPTGASVPITLSGNGSNWVGTFTITPAMGSGNGAFTLAAVDALDNIGHLITSGGFLEIYNTTLPTPPARPIGLIPTSLRGGHVRLTWLAASNAEIYRLYSHPGTNGTPTNLVADNITALSITNLPDGDGFHRYAVTAVRRGAESTNPVVVTARSDRTPPPAPTNVTVLLLATGVQLSWDAGAGEVPADFRVYRNGTLIRTVNNSTRQITDAPPRGVMVYTVAAADSIGNEAHSAPANIELLVGAVNNVEALVNVGQAPVLTWNSTDGTAVGFNIYRNGVKQNAAPQPGTSFVDSLGIPGGGSVVYTVRAVNSTNAESAPRTVEVYDVTLTVRANLSGGAENPLVTRYFDSYRLTLSNRTSTGTVPVDRFEARRTIGAGVPLNLSNVVDNLVGAGNWLAGDIVFPASATLDAQSLRVRAVQEPDLGGSRVVYQNVFDFTTVAPPPKTLEIVANQQPLAGGLATFTVTAFNFGYADMDLLVSRNGGSEPGDLAIIVKNVLGQEVSRTDFNGTPSGTFFTADGRGFLRVPPGGSRQFQVSGVLVPEALGTNVTTFEVVATNIYYRLGSANQLVSGPLSGSTHSSLAVTPYYGTAQTDRSIYANDDVVLITGQAVDRQSGLPRTNVALKIGFFTRGYRFYYDVVTDTNGNYSFTYNPPPGLSGRLKIWAAHPDVFDVLNHAEILIYRAYLSPANAEIRMSKNDKLTFALTLINPGDESLTDFTLETRAWQVIGTNRIAITNITGVANLASNFSIGPRATERVSFELTSALDSPDNAALELILRSGEGAAAKFNATMTLLPANPLLAVIDPAIGYVEVSANRGGQVSKTVSVVNRGLRDLRGVTLTPPTNVSWITVNLPIAEDGRIHLPDMGVGATNTFTLVVSPPTNAPLEFFTEKLVIRGTNSPAAFDVNVYALVTSSQRGQVQFYVDNLLVQSVPNATVRMKNTLLQEELTAKTDANGYVTITNLQEGQWAWQVVASGHSGTVGVVDVIANQTVLVETRLSKSLVTVNFVVTPVPYTDRYEITIEQTFETHVPAPVLVLTPPKFDFNNVYPGFEATFILQAKNHGLIQMQDVVIRGENSGNASLTPLINYFPVLRAQEMVEIPCRFVYAGVPTNAPAVAPDAGISKTMRQLRQKSLTRDIDENGNITGGVQFPPSFGDNASSSASFADCATGGLGSLGDFVGGLMAIANACAQCVDARALMGVAAGAAVTYALLCSPTFSPVGFLPTPCPSAPFPFTFLVNLLSCTAQALGGFGGNDGSGGGNNGGGPRTATGYSGGGPGCFVAGTLVTMANGETKPIEQIATNDVVRTGPERHEVATVTEVLTREANEILRLEVTAQWLVTSGSVVTARTVDTTGEHQFWVDGRGWVAAQNLQAGDALADSAGERVRIVKIDRIPKRTRVYTFTNREDHAFYANGLLVRDSCGDKSPYFQKAAPGAASGTEVAR